MITRSHSAVLVIALVLAGGCRYDPAQQDIIDELGEEKGTPSASHRPGQPCLACHTTYGKAQPALAVGGTLYALDIANNEIVPAKNILVTLFDSKGGSRKTCSNKAGNFYVAADKWEDITFPITPVAGGITMRSLVGRDGSCASCHKLPDEGSLDAITGAGRDSAGVIVVDANATDPSCGGGS